MYHKDDLIVGFNLLDCQIIKIEGNEYTLECIHCHKLYKYDYDKLRRRKTNFCKCTYDWTKNIKEDLTNKIFGDIIVDSLDVDNERKLGSVILKKIYCVLEMSLHKMWK